MIRNLEVLEPMENVFGNLEGITISQLMYRLKSVTIEQSKSNEQEQSFTNYLLDAVIEYEQMIEMTKQDDWLEDALPSTGGRPPRK